MKVSNYTRSALIFFGLTVAFQLITVVVVDLKRPYWGDEEHFVDTINQFGEDLSLNRLRHYEEMSTPLPFVFYSLWGRLVGFEIERLRILSLLIAMATYLLFHRLLYEATGRTIGSIVTAMFLVVHPYMVGFSIFVFTDMLPIFFLLSSVYAFTRERPFLLTLSLAGALLSRQYFAFLAAALFAVYFLRYIDLKRRADLNMIIATLVGLAPVIGLFIFWGSTSPDNTLRELYVKYAFTFHPSFLTLYICQSFLFLLPLVVYRYRTLYSNYGILFLSAAFCWLYFLAPVGPAPPSIDVNILTVGLFHKTLGYLVGNSTIENFVFFTLFLMGLPVILYLSNDTLKKIWSRKHDLQFLLNLIVLAFLVVMPFSYLSWEKYFMPLVPMLTLRLMLLEHKTVT